MAYRRRQQTTHNTAIQSYRTQHEDNDTDVDFAVTGTNPNSSTSLAAKAIRASSAAHRDSSLSSAYGGFSIPSSTTSVSSFQNYGTNPPSGPASTEEPKGYEYTSIKNLNDGKQGFWSSLARKAKSILDDDDDVPGSPQYADSTARNGPQIPHTAAKSTNQNVYPSNEGYRRSDRPTLRKGLNAISSSLSYIGNAVEEGLTVVENRTADIIQETRKHIRIKPSTAVARNQGTTRSSTWQQPQGRGQMQPPAQSDLELQLKASRDVAMAMAAKAKLLLRELKTVKADLAFAKERCAQLEDENKILRDNRGRGENSEDDDLIRLQLETLLAEKARLAHENSVYARENRFLREIVEYHQLTMQDVVYLDEGTEEVTEVYPIKVVSSSQPTEASFDKNLEMGLENPPRPVPPPGVCDFTQSNTQPK